MPAVTRNVGPGEAPAMLKNGHWYLASPGSSAKVKYPLCFSPAAGTGIGPTDAAILASRGDCGELLAEGNQVVDDALQNLAPQLRGGERRVHLPEVSRSGEAPHRHPHRHGALTKAEAAGVFGADVGASP